MDIERNNVNRREFLKSAAALSIWAVTPKGMRDVPAVETEPPEEVETKQPESTAYIGDSTMYFAASCSQSYFHQSCRPGRFSVCDTCRENPRNL